MRRARVVPAEWRTVATVLAIAIVMTSAFAAAYTVALGRPFPHHLRIGIVGAPSAALLGSLQISEHEFDARPFATRQDALAAIEAQQVTAVVDATSVPPELVVSSASDASAARILTQLDRSAPETAQLRVVDVNPLPPEDPGGLAAFYAVIAATILGFVTMFQLRANVKSLTLGPWLASVAVLTVLGGLALAIVTGPVLHALRTPFAMLWLLLSLQVAVAALFNSTMLILVGRWAIIPTWLTFILLGNTSSGGAVSASLLPQPFRFFNHALPSGSTMSALHSATYFPEHQRVLPFVVIGTWLALTLTVLVVVARRLDTSPAQR